MALLVTGVGQLTGNLAFAWLATAGKSLSALTFAIAVENLTGAMATAAFVAYLSSLCNVQFTATQYALLTSLTAQARTVFAAGGGWLADYLGWTLFFFDDHRCGGAWPCPAGLAHAARSTQREQRMSGI